ncbi:hypothetical protein DFJ77DRAFT_509903 [Powellomyces hirtus]|nr:hypothetical protein DFJ77DRAFT_509903 [Powellomyces hirtus]
MSYYENVTRFASSSSSSSLPRSPTDSHDPDPTSLDLTTLDQTSMDSHLPEHNVGYQLLLKMGWRKGHGLGLGGHGRVDPVRIIVKEDLLGLGKGEELDTYHVESTAKRKAMESERIADETESQKVLREVKIQKTEAIHKEIKSVTAAFYCKLCDKQYSKISEYETHLSSYDHNHRQRFKDMQDQSKKGFTEKDAAQKRRREDKERLREEKELKRLQEAAMALNFTPSTPSPTSIAAPPALPLQPEPETDNADPGGWGTVHADADAGGADGEKVVHKAEVGLPQTEPPKKMAFAFGGKKPSGAAGGKGVVKFAFGKKS